MSAKITVSTTRRSTGLRETLYTIDGQLFGILQEFRTTKANPRPIITPKELSILWDCHVETVYQIIAGRRLTAQRFTALAKTLAGRGDYRLIELTLPSNMLLHTRPEFEPNGTLTDECFDLAKSFGVACTLFESGQYKEAKQHIFLALEAVQRASLEIHERV